MDTSDEIKKILEQLSADPSALQYLSPRQFEELIAELLASFGWDVRLTPPSLDGGHDILAIAKDTSGLETTWIVECKKYGPSRKVGVDAALELYGVKNSMRVSNALLATTSEFTKGAQQFAESTHDLQLLNHERVLDWVHKYKPPAKKKTYLEDRQFYSCFISYSHKDEQFAEQLNSALRARGIRVWFAPEDMTPGKKLHEEIDRAITSYDKLLLVLSENSMNSEWVKIEIRKARKREVKEGSQVLFPIALAAMDKIKTWTCLDGEIGKDIAAEVREYFIPDFSEWQNSEVFDARLNKIIKGLQSSDGTVA